MQRKKGENTNEINYERTARKTNTQEREHINNDMNANQRNKKERTTTDKTKLITNERTT